MTPDLHTTRATHTPSPQSMARLTPQRTGAFNISTDRELLVQDDFNRVDGALASPWTVNIHSAAATPSLVAIWFHE